jgi:5-methylcytosine-specific restriction endonuclease McrA
MTVEQRQEYHREAVRRWRLNNKDKADEYIEYYRKTFPERLNLAKKKWRHKNPEKVRAAKRAWYQKNKAAIMARNLIYQRANKDKCSAWRKKSHQLHPETALNSKAKRKRHVGNQRLSRGLTKRLMESQHGLCALCLSDLKITGIHRDHKIPLSRGGLHCDSNIQLTCPTCNLSKHAKILE